MTIKFSTGEEPPDAVLAETEGWLDEAAHSIALTLRAIRMGEFGQIKDAKTHVQNLRAALDLYISERNRVEKLRKQVAGAVGASGLDFDAARDEIGRRLARLRDAGTGG